MSLELCILASGSLGNCSVLRTPAGVFMIDAGLGPRSCAKRLNGTGVRVADIRAICLTHLDSDHIRPTWLATVVARGISIFCHESRREDLISAARRATDDESLVRQFRRRIECFNGRPFAPLAGLSVRPIGLSHDQAGSHGFVIDGHDRRIGYATDLGHVPRALLDHFIDLDVLALESNYDPVMELASSRPWFLKNRIMGGKGHLSNQQALDAIRAILDRCEQQCLRLPEHIVLLHRSRECNCPKLLRKLFARDRRIAPRLTLAEQFERSEWIRPDRTRPRAGEQLTLAWK
jgi:phosphoribosyl 1,2-cyclic phosphodiesterase